MPPIEILRAGRLLLEPVSEIHTYSIWECFEESVEAFRPFLGWVEDTHSIQDIEKFVFRARQNREAEKEFVFATSEPDGVLAGLVGLHNVDQRHRSAELGFWVRTSRTRRGICSAMAARLIRYAFRDLHLYRLFIRHATDNAASGATIRKLGFVHEGTAREELVVAGRRLTHETYSMLLPEFEKLRGVLGHFEESSR
ncbi:MAG: GNAT family N-acetyltransferase [Myxococcales bacterium]|nr:GNAT family N-acetyltransferase [Myxococcales bacterium]